MRVALFFVVGLVAVSALAAEGEHVGLPMVEITGAQPLPAAIKDVTRQAPIQIRTSEELVKAFGKEQAQKIQKQVDFKNHMVVVFAWRGSGQDQLQHTILKSNPPQYRFSFVNGRTKDLRQHVHVIALRLDIKWGID